MVDKINVLVTLRMKLIPRLKYKKIKMEKRNSGRISLEKSNRSNTF